MFSLCLRGFPPVASRIKTCMLGSPVSALGRGTGLDMELVGCPKLLRDGFKAFSSSIGFISLKYMSLNPLGEITEQEKGHSYMLLHKTRRKGRQEDSQTDVDNKSLSQVLRRGSRREEKGPGNDFCCHCLNVRRERRSILQLITGAETDKWRITGSKKQLNTRRSNASTITISQLQRPTKKMFHYVTKASLQVEREDYKHICHTWQFSRAAPLEQQGGQCSFSPS